MRLVRTLDRGKQLRRATQRAQKKRRRVTRKARRVATRTKRRLRTLFMRTRKNVIKWRKRTVKLGYRYAAAIALRRRRLTKRIRQRWWRHGQPVLSYALKQPDRLRLARAGVLAPLREFTSRQPRGAFRPDYSDLLFLYELLRQKKPETVLEFGSGCSTAVIATALRDNECGHLWSVEGDAEWAQATSDALPESLRRHVTVVHTRVLEDDRDVPGWSYEHVPEVDPDFVYLDGPGHTTERKVAFDVLDIESRFRPGFVLVVDGRGRNAYYLRDNLTGSYRFVEYKMRWRHMFRFLFELMESERKDAGDVELRASDASVGS